jgi:hypothetical protein
VARKRERSIRRRERREWGSEEFRLREQQGLSSPGTEEYSSSGEKEEEESDGGRPPPERWEPSPPLAQSRGGGERDGAWGGRRSARRRATYKGGNARRGGAGARRGDGRGCGSGHTGGGDNVRRAPEEKEARVFLPEVGDYFPLIALFRLARA